MLQRKSMEVVDGQPNWTYPLSAEGGSAEGVGEGSEITGIGTRVGGNQGYIVAGAAEASQAGRLRVFYDPDPPTENQGTQGDGVIKPDATVLPPTAQEVEAAARSFVLTPEMRSEREQAAKAADGGFKLKEVTQRQMREHAEAVRSGQPSKAVAPANQQETQDALDEQAGLAFAERLQNEPQSVDPRNPQDRAMLNRGIENATNGLLDYNMMAMVGQTAAPQMSELDRLEQQAEQSGDATALDAKLAENHKTIRDMFGGEDAVNRVIREEIYPAAQLVYGVPFERLSKDQQRIINDYLDTPAGFNSIVGLARRINKAAKPER